MLSCIQRWIPDVWEHNCVKLFWLVITPNYFDDSLWLRYFRILTIWWCAMRWVRWLVQLSKHMICWGSHVIFSFFFFFLHIHEFSGKCVSIIVKSEVLLQNKKKSTSIEHRCFLCGFWDFMWFLLFPLCFFKCI